MAAVLSAANLEFFGEEKGEMEGSNSKLKGMASYLKIEFVICLPGRYVNL